MGLFGNSQTKDFKNKVVDVFNLLSSFSYGELPSSAKPRIDMNYRELKALYNRFSNPFEEYYNSYTTFTSPFGDKTSIAEGMYIICLTKELAFQGMRISKEAHQRIVFEARTLCSSYSGRQEVLNTINHS